MATKWNIKGTASIVFFHFGDPKLTTFFQEIGVKLSGAFDGYDQKVLLKERNTYGGYEISQRAVDQADKILTPTRDNLVKAIRDAAEAGYMIDLWILAHGRKDSGGQFTAAGKDVTSAFLRQELGSAATGFHELPLRLVYQMNCYGAYLNEEWTSLGAKASMGARFVNFYPNRFNAFVRGWAGAKDLDDCRDGADDAATRTVVQAYIAGVHAPATRNEWGGCPVPKTVLGEHPCARKYFTHQWLDASEWDEEMSGKENMNHSSYEKIRGDRSLRSTSSPSWIRTP